MFWMENKKPEQQDKLRLQKSGEVFFFRALTPKLKVVLFLMRAVKETVCIINH